MTADQPDEFLRMHLMAMRIGGTLLRHRARAAIGNRVFFLRKFGWSPGAIGSHHGQLLRIVRTDANSNSSPDFGIIRQTGFQ